MHSHTVLQIPHQIVKDILSIHSIDRLIIVVKWLDSKTLTRNQPSTTPSCLSTSRLFSLQAAAGMAADWAHVPFEKHVPLTKKMPWGKSCCVWMTHLLGCCCAFKRSEETDERARLEAEQTALEEALEAAKREAEIAARGVTDGDSDTVAVKT